MLLPTTTFSDLAHQLPQESRFPALAGAQTRPWLAIADQLLQRTAAAGLSLQHELFRRLRTNDLRAVADGDQNNFTFGFIALTPPVESQLTKQLGQSALLSNSFTFGAVLMRSRGNQEGAQKLLTTVDIAGAMFPVVEIAGTLIRQSSPTHPTTPNNVGSSACWARARAVPSSPWSDAIVTAAHVVSGLPLGATISMSPSPSNSAPTNATVVDIGPCPIDGAILGIPPTMLPCVGRLKVNDPAKLPIAPGSSATLVGRYTNASGRVLRVNQNPGYYGKMLAERIVTDVTGIGGDSGGLVGDGKNTGLGVYMGTVPSGAGLPRDGVAQGMWQLSEWFGADLLI